MHYQCPECDREGKTIKKVRAAGCDCTIEPWQMCDPEDNEEEKPKEESEPQAKKLLKFVTPKIKKLIISDTDSSEIYGLVVVNGHLETMEIGSSQSIRWLKATYFEQTEEIFSRESYISALEMIKARSPFMETPKETIYKRCAFVGGCIYYDLCSPDWNLVKVSKESIEIISHGVNTPTFARSKNQTQQVEPTLDPSADAIDRYCKLLRIENPLFKPHLISSYLESIPVPIIVNIGQQGSIKSTQSALIKILVDPTGSNLEEQLSHLPKKTEDLNLILANNYYVAFDNISYLNSEQSDIFCKTITGASYSKRKLYSDKELIILKIRRKFGLNGITLNIASGDLQERSINYYSGKVPKSERKTESKVMQEFRNIQSDVLGAIFLCLQNTLKIVEQVQLELQELPRMADFTIFGEAIAQSLGYPKGRFVELYDKEIKFGIDRLSEATPLIPFLEENLSNKIEWKEQVKIFYQDLMAYATHYQYDTKILPKLGNKLRDYIRKNQPILEQAGFEVNFSKNTEKNNWTMSSVIIEIKKVSSVSSASSTHTERTEHTECKLDSFTGVTN